MENSKLQALSVDELLRLYEDCISEDEIIIAKEVHNRTGIRLMKDVEQRTFWIKYRFFAGILVGGAIASLFFLWF